MSRAKLLTLFLSLAVGCEVGPTLYLGEVAESDASRADGGPADSGDDDESDDEPQPCTQSASCTATRRPRCDLERTVCVECLDDSHCDDDEHCEVDTGRCDDD